MEELQWDPAWETGVPKIDRQHRELVARLQRLLEACRAGAGPGETQDLLLYVSQYVDFHFTAEEELMVRTDYPDRASHMEVHAGLRDRVADLLHQDMAGAAATTANLKVILQDWLVDHLSTLDRKLAAHLREALPAE